MSNDSLISLAPPGWLSGVMDRLIGYPDPEACWLWPGRTTWSGYGLAQISGHNVRIHRMVWLSFRGPIPKGLVLDHDGPNGCHRKLCANPAHMEVATIRQNVVVTGTGRSAVNAAKTHCIHGHEFTPENIVGKGSKRRDCKTCLRERARVARASS